MPVTAQYVLHGINTSSSFLSHISRASANTQAQVAKPMAAGVPGTSFAYVLQQNPDFTFDCEQVKTALDLMGCGLKDLTAGNTDLYFREVPHKGSRTSAASSAHIRLRAAKAVMVPLTLRASNGAPASLSARVICTYDGTNEPLVPAGSQALSGTPATERFTVGPAAINGSAINGIQDIEIDFGVTLFEQFADGELYVTFVAERERLPVVTIRTLTAALPTLGLNGTALDGSDGLALWLRKCGQTGRVANGTAEHILFTGTHGLVHVPETTGGGNDPAITTIRVELQMADATTAPLSVDTTAGIS